MSLKKQAIVLALQGLNTKAANALRVPGELEKAENVYINKTGELRKRNGSAALDTTATAGTITTGARLSSTGDRMILETPDAVYARSAAANKWVRVGDDPLTAMSLRQLTDGSGTQGSPDATYNGNYFVAAWEQSGGIWYTVQESAGGPAVVPPTLLAASGQSPRVVNVGTNVCIFYYNSVSGIVVRTLNTATPTTLTAQTVVITIALVSGYTRWDASEYTSTYAKVATHYQPSANLCIQKWDAANNTGTGIGIISVYGATQCCGISWMTNSAGTTDHYIAAVFAAPSVRVFKLDTFLGLVSDTQVGTAPSSSGAALASNNVFTDFQPTGYFDGTDTWVYVNCWGSHLASGNTIYNVSAWKSSTVQTNTFMGMFIASKPFAYSSQVYLFFQRFHSTAAPGAITASATSLPAYLLYNATTAEYQGVFLLGNAPTTLPRFLSAPAAGSAMSEFIFGCGRRTNGSTRANAASVIALQFSNHAALGPSASMGDAIFSPSASPRMYDGVASYAIPTLPPEVPYFNGAINTGLANAYQWCVTFEWRDAAGNLYRTAPSIPLANTFSTAIPSASATLWVRYENPTSRTLTAVLWRTLAGGTNFQRSAVGSTAIAAHSTGMMQIPDTMADATLASQEFLYTTGGTIENYGPPPCNLAVSHGGRCWVVSAEFPTELWYSKPYEINQVLNFNGLMSLDIGQPAEGGITALASMDDKLVIFKSNGIYYMYGEGPDATGNGEFADPIRLPTSLGTARPRSVVSTPDGVIFQDTTGQIWQLGRGLELTYIGAGVKDYETQAVTGAVLVSAYNHVRLSCDSGSALVWDRLNQQWFTWTHTASVGACVWRGVHHWLSSAGVVSYETPGAFADGASSIVSTIKLAPVSLSSLAGFGRLYGVHLTGQYRGAHMLGVKLYYDYFTLAADLEIVYPPSGVFMIEAKPSRQKCSAIQIEIYDTPTGAADGFSLSGLTLSVGAKSRLVPTTSNMTPT